jgi:hypothetical protein
MRTGRSLAVIALAAAALVTRSTRTGAQEQPSPAPPDLRMLLNLDLFTPHSSDTGNDAAGQLSNDSMLDQIRALKAMGYLRGKQDNSKNSPDSDAAEVAPGASDVSGTRVTTPNAAPSDSEGQP